TARGRLAMSLSVAKITWIWKSLMSVKRTRMRPSPRFSSSKALPMSMIAPSMSPRFIAAICPGSAPMGAISMPLRPHPCRRAVSADEQIGDGAGRRDADLRALGLGGGLGPVGTHHDRQQKRRPGHGGDRLDWRALDDERHRRAGAERDVETVGRHRLLHARVA